MPSRRSLAIGGGVLVLLLGLAYVALRHRVTEGAVAHSMAATAGDGVYAEGCERRAGRPWHCQIRDSSGPNGYAVRLDGHCWRARRRTGVAGGGGALEQFPRLLEGCISIGDHLRVGERLNPFD